MSTAKAERIVAALYRDLVRRKGFNAHSFLTELQAQEMHWRWVEIVKKGGKCL